MSTHRCPLWPPSSQYRADSAATRDPQRLSWHLQGGGGWRAGTTCDLNSELPWRKLIFYGFDPDRFTAAEVGALDVRHGLSSNRLCGSAAGPDRRPPTTLEQAVSSVGLAGSLEALRAALLAEPRESYRCAALHAVAAHMARARARAPVHGHAPA